MTDTPSPTPPGGFEPRPRSRFGGPTPPWYVGVAGGLLLVILVIVVVLLARTDDSQIQTVAPTLSTTATTGATLPSTSESTTTSSTSSSTTSSSSTSTSSTTSTTASTTSTSSTSASTTSTTVDPGPYRTAVWPWFDSTVRYGDPVAAALGFAVDLLGFDAPVVGPFLRGDSRSGEVELRPSANGPLTTVLVRQLGGDDRWWVLGAVTENIVLDEPEANTEVDSPLTVSGEAVAFEGVVEVRLLADGSTDPLVEGTVTGGGTELAPFEERFTFSAPDAEAGALVLYTSSMDDGRISSATVIRVRFR